MERSRRRPSLATVRARGDHGQYPNGGALSTRENRAQSLSNLEGVGQRRTADYDRRVVESPRVRTRGLWRVSSEQLSDRSSANFRRLGSDLPYTDPSVGADSD